ncbi:hypothetical protein JJE66_36665 [Bradyrhizobium diazoefficiens]|uniref:hypothetical protein n=1 Tax=Bradyrhizobium diazoefficiens TaxID=1355477 RepID=UPI00190CECD4|nr:hypothetical protein [Bradyrhizobium diazoefficiens]MBK3666728.1 hypothetical protein [Bradyrhizobium diazoefficiens]
MKGLVDPLRVSRFIQSYDEAAIQTGINLSIGFDFHEYVSITEATPTKGKTYPIFRPDRSPIKTGEGYWVVGVDANNEVALVDAARLYDLSQSNLAEHLQSLKFFYADPDKQAHPQDRCICNAPSARRITGKVVYHGDLWVRTDFRGQGLTKIMAGIMRGVSLAMWAPDFTCALAGRWSIDKRVYDVAHSEPRGSELQLVAEDIVDDDWLLWTTGDELRSLINSHDRGASAVSSRSPAEQIVSKRGPALQEQR